MNYRKTFTLIELLVVIAVIAILITILLPALKKAKEKAQELVCRNNEKQIAVDVTMYAGDYNDHLPLGNPAGFIAKAHFICPGDPAPQRWSSLYGAKRPDIIVCPSKDDPNGYLNPKCTWRSNYLLRGGVHSPDRIHMLSKIEAGRGMLCDIALYCKETGTPVSDIPSNWFGTLAHRNGWNVAYYDGSVRWYSDPNHSLYFQNATGVAGVKAYFWQALDQGNITYPPY